MTVKKEGDKYLVESSVKGKFYDVDILKPSCTCAHFRFRLARSGGACKHIKEVMDKLGENTDSILDDIRSGNNDAIELSEKYGDEAVEGLKRSGEAFEKEGKLILLE